VSKLDPAQDGTAFVEGKDLPAMDKGKRLFVSLDDEDAKKAGAEIFQAELPKLKPAVSTTPPAQAGAAAPAQSGTAAQGAEGAAAKQQ